MSVHAFHIRDKIGNKGLSISRILPALLLAVIVFESACAPHPRPNERHAREVFSGLYPQAEVDSVWITEDEVVARSFRFRYRAPGQRTTRTFDLQFMEGQDGGWVPSPPPPDGLP